MKIALAHEMLIKLGGAERVLKTLTRIFPEAPIYTLFADKAKTDKWFADKKIHVSRLQSAARWLPYKFLLPKMAGAVERFDLRSYDVVISSSSAFAHGIKTGPKTKHICYCHSPMRYAWDYTHEYTEHYSAIGRFIVAKLLNPIRQWDYRRARDVDVIVANSRHVQKRIDKYWRRDATVIYPPVDVKRFTPTARHEDYFLIVSALTPFKKIDLAIQAFNRIKRKLVIVGEGAQKEALQAMAGDTIEFLGYKPDETVRTYMENCRALIFPGEEDFGITPVEAMAAGKPVLAYGVGGVTESVVAGTSGEFFSEPNPESLIQGLTRLMANEKNYDAQKIRAIAEKFDESVFKDKMLNLISSLS
ncbi:glycosyltransferase [Candidatus Peregrinibacteria bacterium]|nr:glycosyltransferase [Candidatus Peregrinibacteria bacterium]